MWRFPISVSMPSIAVIAIMNRLTISSCLGPGHSDNEASPSTGHRALDLFDRNLGREETWFRVNETRFTKIDAAKK